MSPMKDVVKVASNLVELERLGLDVDFSAKQHIGLEPQSVQVSIQDNVMASYWRLVLGVLSVRSGSMVRHTCGFPCSLAGLLHADPEKSQASWSQFKLLVESFEAASQRSEALVAKAVRESTLQGTTMKWAVKFAEGGKWSQITSQMQELLHCLFRGLGQTKIVEDSIKDLRDKETRVAPSKQLAHFMEWQSTIDAKVLQAYDRNEVQVGTAVPLPAGFTADNIFQARHAADGNHDSMDLRAIMQKQDWVTYTSQSIKSTYPQLQLLRHLHTHDCWHLAGAAWTAGLLPQGLVVEDTVLQEKFMVIRVMEPAALVWPIRQHGDNVFALDLDAKKLEWRFAFDVEQFMVYPAKPLSPLHQHLRHLSNVNGFVFGMVSAKASLLHWQAQNGFAGVPELALSKLCAQFDLSTALDPALTGHAASDQMALALMMLFTPGCQQRSALATMMRRKLKEDEIAQSFLDDFDNAAVIDVVLAGDQQEAKDFLRKREAAKGRRSQDKDMVTKQVASHFPSLRQKVGKVQEKREQKAEATRVQLRQARFYTALSADFMQVVLDEKPPACKVHVDTHNGRFRLWYRGFKDKSVSWTERGDQLAAKLALKQLWEWNEAATGQGIPAHLRGVL